MSDAQAFATSLAQSASADVRPKECFTCRLTGTAALGSLGIYALNQSRPRAPGSIMGKRVMAGVGVCTSHSLHSTPCKASFDRSRDMLTSANHVHIVYHQVF